MNLNKFAQEYHNLVPWEPFIVSGNLNPDSDTQFAVARTMAFIKPQKPLIEGLSIFKKKPHLLSGEKPLLYGPQIEAAIYIMSQFKKPLVNGFQEGFLLGDQPGCGKTRTAGLVIESVLEEYKPKKALYVSVAADSLYENFCNEMKTFSSKHKVHLYSGTEKRIPSKGILFTTYSTLRGKSSAHGTKNKEMYTLYTICNWLTQSFDGVIVFDESHNARNAVTDTGKAVKWIQLFCPRAKVLYITATIGTGPEHFHYMLRLGLWGPDCPFTSFDEFVEQMKDCKINALELIAIYLQGNGRYLARQMNITGLEFIPKRVKLSDRQRNIMDQSATIYVQDPNDRMKAYQTYWGSHQRYQESLIQTFKADAIEGILKDYPLDQYAIVISLKDTGNEALSRVDREHLAVEEYSQCRQIMRDLYDKVEIYCFDKSDNQMMENDRSFLSTSLNNLYKGLGRNPIDFLLNYFYEKEKNKIGIKNAHDVVAEVTGRNLIQRKLPQSVWQTYKDKKFLAEYECVPLHLSSVDDVRAFQEGRKKVAIISIKGSTGISLHADAAEIRRNEVGQASYTPLPRIHVMFQLTWNAEQGLQQLGRVCRANQVSVPKYLVVFTDVPGEIRFQQSFISRVSKLGAICHSERNSGSEVTKAFKDTFSDSTRIANAAVKTLIERIKVSQSGVYSEELKTNLDQVGLFQSRKSSSHKTIDIFLNRVLGMTLQTQEEVLDLYRKIYNEKLTEARDNGDIVPETKEICEKWEVYLSEVVHVFGEKTSVTTTMVKIIADRGVTFDQLELIIQTMKASLGSNEEEKYLMKGKEIICALVKEVYKLSDDHIRDLSYIVYTPWNCVCRVVLAEDYSEWTPLDKTQDSKLIKDTWDNMYKAGKSTEVCIHNFNGKECPYEYEKCRIQHYGSRCFKFVALTGALLHVFFKMHSVFTSKKLPMEMVRLRAKVLQGSFRGNRKELNRIRLRNARIKEYSNDENELFIVGIFCPKKILKLLVRELTQSYAQNAIAAQCRDDIPPPSALESYCKEYDVLKIYNQWVKTNTILSSDDEDDEMKILEKNPNQCEVVDMNKLEQESTVDSDEEAESESEEIKDEWNENQSTKREENESDKIKEKPLTSTKSSCRRSRRLSCSSESSSSSSSSSSSYSSKSSLSSSFSSSSSSSTSSDDESDQEDYSGPPPKQSRRN